MRVKPYLLLLFAGASIGFGACTAPVDLDWPNGTPTPTPPTPTPTPAPIDAFLSENVNICWPLDDTGGGGFPTVFNGATDDRQIILSDPEVNGQPPDGGQLVLWQTADAGGSEGFFERVSVRSSVVAADDRFEVTLYDDNPDGEPLQFRTQYGSNLTRHAQACTFPVYANVTITGVITADPWSDVTFTGGIVAFQALGNVRVDDGGVNVTGAGFRGGQPTVISSPPTACATPVQSSSSSIFAGRRGDGVVSPSPVFGTLPAANGGGGGSCRNFGGGGGGGGGTGGRGGNGDFADPPNGGGQGGVAITNDDLLIMGGGGGAGHLMIANTTKNGTAGGNGGGVVWIMADEYEDSFSLIRANGTNAPGGNGSFGRGGGGGGGTVRLDIGGPGPNVAAIEAVGGFGGNGDGTPPCGAGGGGGGGRIRAPADAVRIASAGGPGLCNTQANAGVTAAEPGIVSTP